MEQRVSSGILIMLNSQNNEQRQYPRSSSHAFPEMEIGFNDLSALPKDTFVRLAALFHKAISLGFAYRMIKGQVNQFKLPDKGDGYDTFRTSPDEGMKNNGHIKTMTTTIDWYADGTIDVTKSSERLYADVKPMEFQLVGDVKTVEGLFFCIWEECIANAHRSRIAERFRRTVPLKKLANGDHPNRIIFEKLCLGCAKPRETRSEYCKDECRTNFWKWCKRQAKAKEDKKTSAIRKKLNQIRRRIPST